MNDGCGGRGAEQLSSISTGQSITSTSVLGLMNYDPTYGSPTAFLPAA